MSVDETLLSMPLLKKQFNSAYKGVQSYEIVESFFYGNFADFIVKLNLIGEKSIYRHIKSSREEKQLRIKPFDVNNPVDNYIGIFELAYKENSDFRVVSGVKAWLYEFLNQGESYFENVKLFITNFGLYKSESFKSLNKHILTTQLTIDGVARYYIDSDDMTVIYYDLNKKSLYRQRTNGRSFYLVYYRKNESSYDYDVDYIPAIDILFSSSQVFSILSKTDT